MASISSLGIGSGLDLGGLVQQLVAAERAPAENRLARQEAGFQSDLSAFGALKGALSSVQSGLDSLQSVSTYTQRQSSVSDSDILSISAGETAAPGTYDIEVSALARTQSLATGSAYTAITDVLGEGEINIRFGTTDYTPATTDPVVAASYNSFAVNADKGAASITIDSTNNTLAGVRDAINEADIGVSASIVNDGSGFRLLLAATDSGAANSLEITVTESGPAGLSALDFNATTDNLSQTIAGQDAALTVNGLAVTSATNKVSSVIDGVDLSLKSITTGTPVTVEVTRNRDAIKAAINGFIGAYNSYIDTVDNLSAFDPETLQAGLLVGDATLRGITSSLQASLFNSLDGAGQFSTLASIGITTDKDGKLQLDSSELEEVLDTDFEAVSELFAAQGVPTDNSVKFISATSATAVGDYAVNITQASTFATNASAATTNFTIDSNNSLLRLKIDGVDSAELTLSESAYASGAALAAELQSKINGDSALKAADVSVSVSYDTDTDKFTISSERYGSASKVEILQVGTTTEATIGFAASSGTDGLDVEGTIGGVAGTGSGQRLTGSASAAMQGLVLEITATSSGSFGTVNFTRGLADGLNTVLENVLGEGNAIELRLEGLKDSIAGVGEDREKLELRMATVEERIRKRFTGLDILVAQLTSTSDFLTTQLANISKISINQNK
ncbi:hypothetical protein A9Q89_08610 [Gammaproteobacteria bacterium 53_120_T64]|nr:hypothetical protein A9Q89_08610 [Gammaproteobacteria bacterium 53_120_T64]